MLKIDITKPIHAVPQFSWRGDAVGRVAKVLCVVPGSKCRAVVHIDGYSSPMIFDLVSGFVQGGNHRIENTPPKMVKKEVTLHTAIMLSQYGRLYTVASLNLDHFTNQVQKLTKNKSKVLKSYVHSFTVEVPEELSASA